MLFMVTSTVSVVTPGSGNVNPQVLTSYRCRSSKRAVPGSSWGGKPNGFVPSVASLRFHSVIGGISVQLKRKPCSAENGKAIRERAETVFDSSGIGSKRVLTRIKPPPVLLPGTPML